MSRPQSAATNQNDRHREDSPSRSAMRSSFYSISLLNNEHDAGDNREGLDAFKEEQARRGAVVDQLNITNILELTQRDREVLN